MENSLSGRRSPGRMPDPIPEIDVPYLFYRSPGDFPETMLETPLYRENGETLENVFSRLGISPNNSYLDQFLVNDRGSRGLLPISLQLNRDGVGLENLGSRDNGIYQVSGISSGLFPVQDDDLEAYLHMNVFNPDRRRTSNVMPGAPSGRNGLSSVGLVDSAGVMDSPVCRNSSVLRSSLLNRVPSANCLRLEDLRLEDFGGRFLSMSKHQYGCRFLQSALGRASQMQIDMVFSELVDHVVDLMLDQFGNYVFQTLIEVCTEEQRTEILGMLTAMDFKLVSICLNSHGTRAVQKLLEKLTDKRQISIVSSALTPGVVSLTKDTNGHHVIQHCLKHFSDEDNKKLLMEVARNSYGIATDKNGCCVLQQCVEYSHGEARKHLISEITTNALLLADHCFGNYVVQQLLLLEIPEVTANLLRQFKGNYVALSCNKYSSNVVEKCLKLTGEQNSTTIIKELLDSPKAWSLFLDPYGNYVMQTALLVSKDPVRNSLVNLVKNYGTLIRSNPYGKRVLACIDKQW